MVGDAGVIQSEVVLVSRKAAGDRKRWVYLDIGKFSGLAETMDESIKYRLRTPGEGTRMGPVVLAGPTCDSADILYEKTEYKMPLSLRPGDKVEILSTGAYTTSGNGRKRRFIRSTALRRSSRSASELTQFGRTERRGLEKGPVAVFTDCGRMKRGR